MSGFILATCLNFIIFFQIILYWSNTKKVLAAAAAAKQGKDAGKKDK